MNQSNPIMRSNFAGPIPQMSNQTNSIVNQTHIGAAVSENQNLNTATLCKVGQDTVQEIVYRTIEIFKELKMVQLPNGSNPGTQLSLDKKKKVLDNFNVIRQLFVKLKIIYDKVNNNCSGMDYTPIETLIPYKSEVESKPDPKKISESYNPLLNDNRELKELLSVRSSYLKELIYQLRKIMWDINTMLAMRSS